MGAGPPAAAQEQDLGARYEAALRRFERGAVTAAFQEFKAIAAQSPTFAEAVYNAASIASSQDRARDCVLYTWSFLALRPDDEEAAALTQQAERCARMLEERGTLRLGTLEPPGTIFYLDGMYFGPRGDRSWTLPAGTFSVTADRTDHVPFSGTVVVPAGGEAVFDVVLPAMTFYGTVLFDVSVEGATIFLDDAAVATAPMTEPLQLEVGRYLFRVEAPGFHPWNRRVSVERERDHVETVRLLDLSVNLDDL
jgi:hypothetical protein